MTKTEAKKEIEKLIGKYQAAVSAGKAKKYTEEETKKGLIEPLFKILGWDFTDNDEVSAEEYQTSGGRVDYGFYLNNAPKFFLEAKAIKQDIHKEDFARQALRYSWNKGVTWAVLTNFERILIFNAQDTESHLSDRLLFEIPYNEFIKRFEQLWYLSKESFEEDAIDKYAESIGKKIQKVSITATLYKDITKCREILTKYLSISNPREDQDFIDEGVQKLLGRLIFIRVAEDRKIEPPTLKPILHEWLARSGAEGGRGKITLYKAMIDKFRELDKIYNSNLFLPHPFENWDDNNDTLEKVIPILYGKEGYYEYDFKAMPADILGSVYENYLGYRLSKSKKGTTISKDAKKRKEHGIYYTPTFIVDYIVRNALKPVLDNCKSVHDLKKIKVLDPACGSGSFLIKALEVIYDKYKYLNYGGPYTKFEILTENIYGVDLDEQAIEIARLNLLVSALDEKIKLPILNNLKVGNSLISGTDEELKKYFGPNFRDKKPFNWQEEFKDVFAQGGFDVVIGNPPYVTTKYGKITEDVKKFYLSHFESAYDKLDLYVLFIEKAIKISKKYGIIAFITPWNFLANFYSFKIRKFLLDNVKINLFNKLSPNVFEGVITDNIISIFEKDKNNKNNQILFDDLFNKENQKYINQDSYLRNEKYVFTFPGHDDADKILDKMRNNSVELGKIALNYIGIMTGGQKEMIAASPIFKNSKPVLSGKDITRWIYFDRGNFVNFDKSKIHSNDNEKVYLAKKKILLRKTGRELVACLDKNQFFTIQSLYNIIVKNRNYTEEYLLALLNSKLFTFIYNKFFITNPEVFPYIKRRHLDQLPIKVIPTVQQKMFITLVDKVIKLNKELQKTTENSNKWQSLKSEIEKTDKKIDEEIYKLYGLTKEEIKIVENNAK